VTESEWQAEEFEQHRARLGAVAYRMLGSASEAEDAVQEAWLRLQRSEPDSVDNLGGWLTTVVARVALDMLRARRARCEDYVGDSMPDPIVTVDMDSDPEQRALLADSVGLALLVVLDTLSPSERLAFVLHDMFDVPFGEVARVVDRTPDAARQLASRARRRVRGAAVPDVDIGRQREVVEAFLAASRAGDFDALVAVLDPGVVFRADAPGGRERPPIEGSEAVARQVLARGSRLAPMGRPAIVNGAAGAVVVVRGKPRAVVAMTVRGGRVAAIDLIVDPDRLRRVDIDERLLR
jgi:RNA polymerase sigma-70 factor (ECF subfamily)